MKWDHWPTYGVSYRYDDKPDIIPRLKNVQFCPALKLFYTLMCTELIFFALNVYLLHQCLEQKRDISFFKASFSKNLSSKEKILFLYQQINYYINKISESVTNLQRPKQLHQILHDCVLSYLKDCSHHILMLFLFLLFMIIFIYRSFHWTVHITLLHHIFS